VSGADRLGWLILTIGVGWLVYLLAPILTPFIASALLAYLGDPLVDRLEKLKIPRTIAVLTVFVLLFAILGALTILIIPLVRTQVSALVLQLPEYVDSIERELLPKLHGWLGISGDTASRGLTSLITEYDSELRDLASGALRRVSRSGGAFITALLNLFLVPVITFYLLRDWDLLMARLAGLIPERRRRVVLDLAHQSDIVLSAFMRGQLLVVVGLAIIYTVGLMIVGLDFAVAIGVLAGLVSFVPYLGLFVGVALASLAALVQIGGIAPVGGVILVFVVGQMIEGTLLTPKLVGTRIGLHPVIVIFAVMAGGQLFGFLGILLALPAAAVLSVLVRFGFEHYRGRASSAPPETVDG
jgi:predicted PurR-regulated permease PerM